MVGHWKFLVRFPVSAHFGLLFLGFLSVFGLLLLLAFIWLRHLLLSHPHRATSFKCSCLFFLLFYIPLISSGVTWFARHTKMTRLREWCNVTCHSKVCLSQCFVLQEASLMADSQAETLHSSTPAYPRSILYFLPTWFVSKRWSVQVL